MCSKKSEPNLVFIIGSHRTGTKLLGNFFNYNFIGVKSVHQYSLLRFNNILSNLFLANWISEDLYIKYLKKFWFKKLSNQIENNIYVESNGFNFLSAYYAEKHFKNVKIVHIIRDPREYIYSYTNWIENRWQSKLINKIPFWHVSGYRVKQLSKKKWKAYSKEEKMAWYWNYKNKLIAEKYSNENYLLLRFEDLINSSKREKHLKNLLEFMNLKYRPNLFSYFDKKQNESIKSIGSRWRNWDKNLSLKINEICSKEMKKFGYGEEELWLKKISNE